MRVSIHTYAIKSSWDNTRLFEVANIAFCHFVVDLDVEIIVTVFAVGKDAEQAYPMTRHCVKSASFMVSTVRLKWLFT